MSVTYIVLKYTINNTTILTHFLFVDATLEKLAIDTNLKIIFFTDSGQSKIVRMDYLGNTITTILDSSNDLQLAAGITLHSTTR